MSGVLALAARCALALALAASAIAKLRTRDAVRGQVAVLLGERVAPAISALLPVAELAVAVALVGVWNPVPGVVALILLAAFTGVLVRAQVLHVPCLCFGASSLDAPVGPAGIVRNGVFMALAVLAIGSPHGAALLAGFAVALAFVGVEAVAVRAAR